MGKAFEYGIYDQEKLVSNIKSFTKEQIAKAKDEERARIRGVIEKHKAPAAFVGSAPGDDAVGSEQRAFGRNCALTDILKEIGE